jgi:hypothetical protein
MKNKEWVLPDGSIDRTYKTDVEAAKEIEKKHGE